MIKDDQRFVQIRKTARPGNLTAIPGKVIHEKMADSPQISTEITALSLKKTLLVKNLEKIKFTTRIQVYTSAVGS